jgi:hypothetical protein
VPNCVPVEGGCHIGAEEGPPGHSDVKTAMMYTDVLNRGPAGVRSPVDMMAQGGPYADPHKTPWWERASAASAGA